jgi:hypothetical protein
MSKNHNFDLTMWEFHFVVGPVTNKRLVPPKALEAYIFVEEPLRKLNAKARRKEIGERNVTVSRLMPI